MVTTRTGCRMSRETRPGTAPSVQAPAPAPLALVFTDLDGTLLDDNYRFEAARPALARLRALRVPLVLCSSKTLSEMRLLRSALDLDEPLIFENGAGIAVPEGRFPAADAPAPAANPAGANSPHGPGAPLQVETFGPGYAELRRILVTLRERHGFPFRGFGDMTSAEVADRTGLDQLAAARARQRIGSEPGIWSGSEAVRQDFVRELQAEGLRAVHGGRFLHIMPQVDKAGAVAALVTRFRALWPDAELPLIAAGDSPNDAAMLLAADHALVIRRGDGSWMPLKRSSGVLRSATPGAAGWNDCMHRVLDLIDDRVPGPGAAE